MPGASMGTLRRETKGHAFTNYQILKLYLRGSRAQSHLYFQGHHMGPKPRGQL